MNAWKLNAKRFMQLNVNCFFSTKAPFQFMRHWSGNELATNILFINLYSTNFPLVMKKGKKQNISISQQTFLPAAYHYHCLLMHHVGLAGYISKITPQCYLQCPIIQNMTDRSVMTGEQRSLSCFGYCLHTHF